MSGLIKEVELLPPKAQIAEESATQKKNRRSERQKREMHELLPLEEHYRFHEFHSPALEEADFENKPMVLLVGQYSTGKTTFIRKTKGFVLKRYDCIGHGGSPHLISSPFFPESGLMHGSDVIIEEKLAEQFNLVQVLFIRFGTRNNAVKPVSFAV
ncbi:hypothetical protein EK904_009487 [Melospiza melodia maxima]|nr:hypothetical protein EK904_009487 [Melospiza melodia maxima]